VAQLNPTVGDFEGNIARMKEAAAEASAAGSALIVFPELSLTGYYPGDLLDEPRFLAAVDRGLAALAEATRATPGLHWVVGAPTLNPGPGKRLHNSLLVVLEGRTVLAYAKQLLPTYNVFDERRHFEPGPDVARVLRIAGAEVGFMICEDGWNDDGSTYTINPLDRMAAAAPDLVVSTNASPSNIGKREQRHELFEAASRRHGFPIVYVNQVGGQDQLVFDGASFAVTPKGGLEFEARRFAEDVVTLAFTGDRFERERTTPAGAPAAALEPAVARAGLPTMEFYRQQIVLGVRDYARRCGFSRAVVGSSGGIDSALTLTLAVEALGAERVVGVTMPSRVSSPGSVTDSAALCRNLGIRLHEHPIRELVDGYGEEFARAFGTPLAGLPLENLQARVRGTILMEFSNAFGHLLLTTGNKSEIAVGYCTLYGDTNGGLGPIGDLYKTEVFELCRHINATAGRALIPREIIDKEPSAELAPGQRDIDSLPPYPVLDAILKHLIDGEPFDLRPFGQQSSGPVEGSEIDALVKRIRKMVARNEYKRRQAPPVLRLRARAFGSGRQMPIAARYE
jgi:NAD+ synthase/NAD+ synthase (glutamine-hydrolysing)